MLTEQYTEIWHLLHYKFISLNNTCNQHVFGIDWGVFKLVNEGLRGKQNSHYIQRAVEEGDKNLSTKLFFIQL